MKRLEVNPVRSKSPKATAVPPMVERTSNGVKEENLKRLVEEAAHIINNGGIIVCPTDTIYGLLADATNKEAVEKIYRMKRRSLDNPLPIFVPDLKTVRSLAVIKKRDENFLKNYWPGKLTAVFKRKGRKKIFGVDKKTIGLRIPDYQLIILLLKKIGKPLVETSVNISGQSAKTKIKEIVDHFDNEVEKPDLILDAGDSKETAASTVVDLSGKEPKILRQGDIIPIWTTKRSKK